MTVQETVRERIAQLRRAVETARSVPMSASAVVDRAELLAMIDGLERAMAEEPAAEAMRREVDEYVDTALANFEVTLERTLATVRRGRRRLADAGGLDARRDDDVDRIRLPDHLEG